MKKLSIFVLALGVDVSILLRCGITKSVMKKY